jgi:hypothetical protein
MQLISSAVVVLLSSLLINVTRDFLIVFKTPVCEAVCFCDVAGDVLSTFVLVSKSKYLEKTSENRFLATLLGSLPTTTF